MAALMLKSLVAHNFSNSFIYIGQGLENIFVFLEIRILAKITYSLPIFMELLIVNRRNLLEKLTHLSIPQSSNNEEKYHSRVAYITCTFKRIYRMIN